jgi:hypothetical protein
MYKSFSQFIIILLITDYSKLQRYHTVPGIVHVMYECVHMYVPHTYYIHICVHNIHVCSIVLLSADRRLPVLFLNVASTVTKSYSFTVLRTTMICTAL